MGWFGEGERGLARASARPPCHWAAAWGLAAAHPGRTRRLRSGVWRADGGCLASIGLILLWLREPPPARIDNAGQRRRTGLRLLVWRLALGIGLLCAPQVALISFGGIFLHEVGQASLSSSACSDPGADRCGGGAHCQRPLDRPAWPAARLSAPVRLVQRLAVALLGAVHVLAGWRRHRPAMVLVVAGVVVSAWHGVAYTELAVVAGRPRSAPPWAWATVACSWSFFLTAQAIPPRCMAGLAGGLDRYAGGADWWVPVSAGRDRA
jgi:hypothetical protein